MAAIQISNLVKDFEGNRVIDDVSFVVNDGEIVVVVGESGCGKTTTLRCIAGLEVATSGEIHIDGEPVATSEVFVPPERRGIGMVFQSYALWPHMTVFENVAYGLRLQGCSRETIKSVVSESLKMVGLSGKENRYPSMLSGGQQQRVALARSAAAKPKVLLLDEPLSNLDAKLREQMRRDLRAMIKELGTTAIYITHDQGEAMAVADRIIYMRNGKIEQVGTAKELYRNPRSVAVAEFIGSATFLKGRLLSEEGSSQAIEVSKTLVFHCEKGLLGENSSELIIGIRPETVRLSRTRLNGVNVFQASILSVAFLGEYNECMISVDGVCISVRTPEDVEEGEHVYVKLEPKHVICLPAVASPLGIDGNAAGGRTRETIT